MAALMIEEEEREEAAKAQSKVRGVELVPVRAASDAVSLGVGVWRSEVPAAAFLWRRLSAQCGMCSGDGAQQKSKAGKAGGGGGGLSSKVAAVARSSSGEASTSRGEGSRPSTLLSGDAAGLRSAVELPSAEAASGAQRADSLAAGSGKKMSQQQQRKERQKQRKLQEAREALQ
jgi:hypothetical protein